MARAVLLSEATGSRRVSALWVSRLVLVLGLGFGSLAWVGFIAASHAPAYQAEVAGVALAGCVACSFVPARRLISSRRRKPSGKETAAVAVFGAIVGVAAAHISEAVVAFGLAACGGWLVVLAARSYAGSRRPTLSSSASP